MKPLPIAMCMCCGFQFYEPLTTPEVEKAHAEKEAEIHKRALLRGGKLDNQDKQS